MLQNPGHLSQIQLQLDELSPFLAVVLIRNESPFQAEEQSRQLRRWLEENLEWFNPDDHRVIQSVSTQQNPLRDKVCVYTILHYTERKKATWTRQDEVRDHINHVVVMASWGKFSALHFSDNDLKGRFIKFLGEQEDQELWSKPIEKNRLNAIFIDGPARTLWLAGIHRRKSIRADSKILMGAKIQDALNPLEDQSFYFTSARCFIRDWERTTGVSPNKSHIWIRKSRSWNDYQTMVEEVLLRLSDNYDQMIENPFPILATPLINLDTVHTAFDMNFLFPEISVEDARVEDQDTIQLLDDLSYHTNFDVSEIVDSPNLDAQITYDGQVLGSIRVDFHNTLDDKREWVFDLVLDQNSGELAQVPPFTEIRRIIRYGKYLQIRYESGHTFSGGEFYSLRFRDLPFTGWRYKNFDGYDIDREKPTTNESIGSDHSLFCWVWNEYTENCWLYCDDRSREVADFIKYQTEPGAPKITLIHVKAAKGTENRRFSVSAYEVVTAQAIKNLRHFEFGNFIEQIAHLDDEHFLHRIKHNGLSPANISEAGQLREEFTSQLTANGVNIGREVVVIQPHNRQTYIIGGNENNNARCQLHTLLLSAETACRNLGADFYVFTDQS